MKLTKRFVSIVMLLTLMTSVARASEEKATFAGGCFWCMEHPFIKLDGVSDVTSGYMGGDLINPTYEEVSSGRTKHSEVVQVLYDPKKVSYTRLLEVFWINIDPTDIRGQFADRGPMYRPAIFFYTEKQREIAQKSKEQLEKSGRFMKKIVVPIEKAKVFYPAEDYHQKYYRNNPVRYHIYRYHSGRDQFLNKYWSKEERKKAEKN